MEERESVRIAPAGRVRSLWVRSGPDRQVTVGKLMLLLSVLDELGRCGQVENRSSVVSAIEFGCGRADRDCSSS